MDKFDFIKKDPVAKGLSSDKKYYVETAGGQKYLLRVSDISEYHRKKAMFDHMNQAAALGVPMCEPMDFGVCDNGKSVYQLLTWCNGENLENLLPTLPETEQYRLGVKAGEILRKIHSVPAPENLENWCVRYFRQNHNRIKAFSDCNIKIEGSDAIFSYIGDNKDLLCGRPQCFNHGDYHVGNLMLTDDGKLIVVDWEPLDFDNFADPWNEFSGIGNSDVVPHFTAGLIRGYFGEEPSKEFWRLLALYLAAGALMLVSWAFYTQHDELKYATQHVKDVLSWYDGMQNIVPTWYIQSCKG